MGRPGSDPIATRRQLDQGWHSEFSRNNLGRGLLAARAGSGGGKPEGSRNPRAVRVATTSDYVCKNKKTSMKHSTWMERASQKPPGEVPEAFSPTATIDVHVMSCPGPPSFAEHEGQAERSRILCSRGAEGFLDNSLS